MTNELTSAWEMLTPEQRPVGMVQTPAGNYWHDRKWMLPNEIAYDRLCVACERVVLEAGCTQEKIGGDYVWGKFPDVYGGHRCQLTAAVLAIEAIKGGDK